MSEANQVRKNKDGGKMFGIGMPELIIIMVIILIIFGAGKIPEIGSGLGKGIRDFKRATSGDLQENEEWKEVEKLEEKKV